MEDGKAEKMVGMQVERLAESKVDEMVDKLDDKMVESKVVKKAVNLVELKAAMKVVLSVVEMADVTVDKTVGRKVCLTVVEKVETWENQHRNPPIYSRHLRFSQADNLYNCLSPVGYYISQLDMKDIH